MTWQHEVHRLEQHKNYDRVIQEIPYARFIGMSCIPIGQSLIFTLPAKEDNLGNPTLPALHGGVIAGFMEMSASLFVLLTQDVRAMPKVIDFAIDYLRPGRLQETYTEVQVIRHGKKIVNAYVLAWQDTKKTPTATARVHLLLH